MTTAHVLETAGADIAYDVHGPLPTADGRPPLFMIGQPMDAGGFATLASHFPDRTVVTYDPRGLGRSVRRDGRVDHVPTVQAEDVHALIEALGAGPIDMFASSGGAVTALALVTAHPDDVRILVAHEPPLIPVLDDAEAAEHARAGVRVAYEAKGPGAGMAAFIAMTSWRGEFTDDYFAQPPADPAAFGMPTEDDGSRDDPLLSDRSWAVSGYGPDVAALAAAPTRVVIGVGEESAGTFTGRTAVATAELLGQQATVFPATTAASSAASSDTPANPRPSRASCATCSTRPAGETMTSVNPADATTNGESLWPRLAGLPLVIEACEYDRLYTVLAYEFERITTHVRLVGAGTDGLGEDVSVFRENGTALHETRPSLPLDGEWTLAGFCDHLATLELWPEPPEWDVALRFRKWAFESAALDLALRQAGRSLHDVLGLEPQPVRFVNSLGLGKEPSIEPLRRRLARSPDVRFKLDAEATWAPALVDEVAATGAVDTIDFKGQYGFEVKDPEALGALYDRVLAAFPDAYLEDPHDRPEIARRLSDHLERVSYDSPIRSVEDIGATPLAARVVNVKPSRIGGLRPLLAVYARCVRERRPMYGGGMGELGVGRGQIELLASLFHADAPNDVAPSAYNEDDPPGGLPASPLAPRPEATGFRWGP